jgi:hypothetical protein
MLREDGSEASASNEGSEVGVLLPPYLLQYRKMYGVYKPFEEHKLVKNGGLTTCLKGTA